MLNFSFHNPTQIHFGEKQIAALAQEIPAKARVLMVYGGGSIKKNGVYQQVSDALQDHTWFEFSGIEPNPNYDTLMKAQAIIRAEKIDYLLAVGGGSVVDGVKFIAAAACFDGEDPWSIIAEQAEVKAALPIGVVLTLPATGSESNIASVVTRDGHKLPFMSPLVRPQFAILDPAVTLSLSDRQISNGVVDAFVHIMEQYLTYPVNAQVQDRFAESLLKILVEEGPIALAPETKNNIDTRANIMWSATMALNGLIGAGVPQDWSTHMIGHELTAKYGIDHARSLSIILPAVMKVCKTAKRAKLIQFAERVWGIKGLNDDKKIAAGIEATESFFNHMGAPTRLSHANVPASDIESILENLKLHGMTALGEHGDITIEVSREILKQAL